MSFISPCVQISHPDMPLGVKCGFLILLIFVELFVYIMNNCASTVKGNASNIACYGCRAFLHLTRVCLTDIDVKLTRTLFATVATLLWLNFPVLKL